MYDNYIRISKRFKSSVNLSYDLYNEDKIAQYVPTTDLCDVIKSYAKAILSNEDKSTLLAGPYGKGKSYLMLMLTFLFSKRENQKLFKLVLDKINSVDSELATILKELNDNNISLLPIIINNNSFDDVNQNFMIALNNSLKDHGINDVVPSTVYGECLLLIHNWENNTDGSFDILDLCLKKLNINLKELKNGLKNYELKYYKMFEELFSCVSHGYKFNPLISNDIGLVYSDVSRKINEYGYTGLFVIFDEFGSFLDNQYGDFTGRLNKIQSFAEKANSSEKSSQIHFCCVIHKDIKLYCDKENAYKNAFETIAGRFSQKRFDRTLDENYQIICQALEKSENYYECKNIRKYNKFINELKESGIFNNINQVDYIFENGYPFNPVSLYALVQASEKVAQNERTLFTFLSDNDVNSFNYFITNNSQGLLNVSIIYDYFEDLIYNSEEYKNIYYKVESLKRLTNKKEEHDILKVIALMKVIDDDIKYTESITNIALSLNKEVIEVETSIKSMIERNLLKKNLNDNTVDFAIIADEKVNDLINEIIIQKISNEPISSLLDKFDTNIYHFSNEYNFLYKMVRFYRSVYLEASTLDNLRDLTSLFIGHECDGLIINLINDNKTTIKRVEEKLSNENYKNIIVRYTKDMISEYAIDKLKRIFAAKQLLMKRDISESLKISLPVYIEDSSRELNKYLQKFYSKSKAINCCNFKKNKLNECIKYSLRTIYNRTVILNNELVNKNSITAVTAKARNTIVDNILSSSDCNYGTTSQEATIYESFKISVNNHQYIIDEITSWIISSNGNKINFNDLITKLKSAPYGMRNGVIPLFLAEAINRISIKSNNDNLETVILYNDSQEIELNAQNLAKIITIPNKYYLNYASINNSKINVINSLVTYFGDKPFNNFSDSISFVVKKIKYKMNNLADIIINSNNKDNLLGLSKKELQFKEVLMKHDLNNYEILFEKLPKTLECNFEELDSELKMIFKSYDNKLDSYSQSMIEELKNKFVYSESIKSSYELWKTNYQSIGNVIFENKEKRLYNALNNIAYKDKDALDIISNAVLGCTISAWNSKRQKTFFDVVESMKKQTESYVDTNNIKEDVEQEINFTMSSLGKTLYSNLQDSLEEYGDALSNEEKVLILKKLLKEVIS